MTPFRVLHLPTSVGGNPQGLSAALRQEGVGSDTLTTEQNYLQYPVDIVVNPDDAGPLRREWRRWRTLWRDVPGYDVLHFNFGTTLARPHAWSASPGSSLAKRLAYPLRAAYLWLLQGIELARAKRQGVPMFVTYQGDDARQGTIHGPIFRSALPGRSALTTTMRPATPSSAGRLAVWTNTATGFIP